MSIEWAQTLLQNISHVAPWRVSALFAVFGFGQILVPPFPGDILLFFGGGLWPGGFFAQSLTILLPYWLGTTIGSLGAYELGARFGIRIFSWRWVRRFFPDHAQHAVTRWLNTSGAITIFGAKFVTGMNVPMLIISGAMGYERRKCYPVILLTTVVHNCLFYGLGTLLGDNWTHVAAFFGKYQVVFVLLIALFICAALLVPKMLARLIAAKGSKEQR